MIEQHEIMSMKKPYVLLFFETKPSTTGHDIMLSGMRGSRLPAALDTSYIDIVVLAKYKSNMQIIDTLIKTLMMKY